MAILNSSVIAHLLSDRRRNNVQLYPDDWKKLPIPDATPEQQTPIIALVDQILTARRADPSADVSALEKEIDEIVYKLYGLTAEIKLVEEKR